MGVRKISATEASRSFSGLLNRVKYAGEKFVGERGGLPFGRIVPVEATELLTLEALARIIEDRGTDRATDPGFADAIEEASKLGNAPAVPVDPSTR